MREGSPEPTRPVWSGREFRDYVVGLAMELQRDNERPGSGGTWGGIGHLFAFAAAWDAAPENATEAVRDALLSTHIYRADEADGQARTEAHVDALAIVAALGGSQETTT